MWVQQIALGRRVVYTDLCWQQCGPVCAAQARFVGGAETAGPKTAEEEVTPKLC